MNDKAERYSEYFQDNIAGNSLKEQSLNGGIWILTGQFGGHSLRILSIIILARLLTPGDYGLVAMVAVLTNFIQMFKDIGLNVATVQSKHITHQQISNLFWYNSGISIFLGIIVAASAPLITSFYNRPELFNITLALSVTFPVSGLIIQHIALLQRRMKYKEVAFIQIFSIGISIVVVICCALSGLGYWSLVIMELTGVCFTTFFAFRYCPWIPSLPDKTIKTTHLLSFGGFLTGANFCEYLSNNLDKLLIGKYLNSSLLGQYTKAFDLSLLPIRKINYPLDNLAISTLSKLQDNPARYRNYYTFAQESLLIILLPFFGIGYINSKEIFHFLLGSQWLPAAPIFSWFCILSAVTCWSSPTRWLFLSQGRANEFLYATLTAAILSIISFIIGLPYGILGISISYTLFTVFIRTPLFLFLSSRHGSVSFSNQVKTFIPICTLTLIMLLLIYLTQSFLNLQNNLSNIIVALIIYLTTFTIAFFTNKYWRSKISRLAELFFTKIKRPIPTVFLKK